ncbi:ammonia channel protein [Subtercola boreus]|uniref:Ammonium transporter n=1 Tax=Subtercola boreus TaxID=120213 RepID=A0A3E0VYI1_9MICO|nr:ammonium transporter [Subtercola boreus]RFA14791.1 ammonia channel protein [Subtercola boreus]
MDPTIGDLTTTVNALWLLVAAALVLIMTPGVAFFYGGMVKAKSVVSMMMMSFGAMGLVGVLWVLYGYGFAFGTSVGDTSNDLIKGVLGNPSGQFLLGDLVSNPDGSGPNLYGLAFAGFQATFAIITVALISGAIADRAKFGSWMLFAFLWVTIVYFPVAHWVFNFTLTDGKTSDGGWIVFGLGVNDFAGGTAVHINAGAAGLALALVLGKRIGFQKGIQKPHNVPLTLLGAALLWFGWFGFNAGSEAAVDGTAALAWINTLAAPAAAILGWLIVEKVKDGKPTSIGAASGAVSGLVAITPACNILTPGWGMVLGLITGAVCCLAIELKFKLGFDDSLDVVGIHLVGGIIGTLYIGIFGTGIGLIDRIANGDATPLSQLGAQAVGAGAVLVFSFVIAWLLGTAIQKTIGFRISTEDEVAGVDTVVHGEESYALDPA